MTSSSTSHSSSSSTSHSSSSTTSPSSSPLSLATTSTAAAVVGAAQFLPVPVLDDWIASFSRRQLARAIARRHGRTFSSRDLAVLTDDGSIWGLPWRMAKSVALAPVKKLLRPLVPFWIARDVALVVGRTLALGAILERHLALGGLRDDDSRAARRDEAKRMRRALDTAWKGVDERALRAVVAALVKREKPSAVAAAVVDPFFASLMERFDRALAELPADRGA